MTTDHTSGFNTNTGLFLPVRGISTSSRHPRTTVDIALALVSSTALLLTLLPHTPGQFVSVLFGIVGSNIFLQGYKKKCLCRSFLLKVNPYF